MAVVVVLGGCAGAGATSVRVDAPSSTSRAGGAATSVVPVTSTSGPSAGTTAPAAIGASVTTAVTATTDASSIRPPARDSSSTTVAPALTTATPTTATPTTVAPTTVAPTTTWVVPPVATVPPGAPRARIDPGSASFAHLRGAVDDLVAHAEALTVSVARDGATVFGATAGRTVAGAPVTSRTDFVLASVSKMVTALSVARLVEQHRIDLAAPVPWSALGIPHDPTWDTVTVRELLSHGSGMPVAGKTWLDLPGSCAVPLADALAAPPLPTRGTWTYSNGNYCALGLLVEHVTHQRLDAAARALVFDPLGLTAPHLTKNPRTDDAPYDRGLARLERLGGAGTWMMSSSDVARMMAAVTDADRVTLAWPGIMIDQYGWGHTGTLDGAKACTWVMQDGRTVLAVVLAGNRPWVGSQLCDQLVPALAADLGVYAGDPVRSPD
jgi:D-alanyl-D-alanine carboxypeptidase